MRLSSQFCSCCRCRSTPAKCRQILSWRGTSTLQTLQVLTFLMPLSSQVRSRSTSKMLQSLECAMHQRPSGDNVTTTCVRLWQSYICIFVVACRPADRRMLSNLLQLRPRTSAVRSWRVSSRRQFPSRSTGRLTSPTCRSPSTRRTSRWAQAKCPCRSCFRLDQAELLNHARSGAPAVAPALPTGSRVLPAEYCTLQRLFRMWA